MNIKNGNEDGLRNGQKLMFYPINEVGCGINYVHNFCLSSISITKLLSYLHTSLLMASR